MIRIVSEQEFSIRIQETLSSLRDDSVGCVTGPGRSGAIASVYASHILKIPFLPYNSFTIPKTSGKLLIIDTARESGATMRKAVTRYEKNGFDVIALVCFEEPPRVAFWYEAPKPQRFKHESTTIIVDGKAYLRYGKVTKTLKEPS